MSRDSSGNYSLPSGNPVVTGTTIDSTVHNNTTSDIATELTDSLSRSGKGGMLAVFKLLDGTVSSPGAQFANDANTGMYRVTTDTLGLAAGGVLVVKGEAATVTIPVKLVVESAESVDLSASTAGFAIGDLSGQHIEFDDAEMQSKSNSTTAATLSLNRLGGAVNIGAQSGTGTVTLYNNTDQCLITQEDGVAIKDGDGSTPTINLVNSAGTAVGQIIYSSGLYLQSLVNSSNLVLNGYSSGAVQRSVFVGDPNGNSTMYYAGQVGLQAVNTGQIVYSSVNDNPEIGMYQDDKSTRNALIQAGTSGLTLYQEVHGAPITLVSENNAGAQKTLLIADPDGSSTSYYAGTAAVFTASQGIGVQSTSGSSTSVAFYSTGSTLEGVAYTQSAGQLVVRAELANRGVTLQGTDSGNADSTLFDAAPDGAATLYYDNTAALATAAIATNGTGATVTDGGGTARPVGLNITPITTASAGTDLRIANSGHLIRCTSAITVDIDTTTDTAPNGSFWTIENAAGANCTISATGVNLVWLDGSAGTTGSRTFAAYGYVTILKVSNGNYRIVGTGLS